MLHNKGIGRKFKPKRNTSVPDLRPKGKQKLETKCRAEEPCNIDSDGDSSPIAMMALVQPSVMRCTELQSLLFLSRNWKGHMAETVFMSHYYVITVMITQIAGKMSKMIEDGTAHAIDCMFHGALSLRSLSYDTTKAGITQQRMQRAPETHWLCSLIILAAPAVYLLRFRYLCSHII